MRTPATLLAFVLGLVVLFGLAISVGESVGPIFGLDTPAAPEHGGGEHGPDGGDQPAHPQPGGLAIADGGYVLWPIDNRFPAGTTSDFRFTIFTVDRRPVTDFGLHQAREMDLVVVRRDMTEYQRLRPTMQPDGTWIVRLRLDEPGSYRAFATFRPRAAAHPVTLGVDLEVPGQVESRAVTQPSGLTEVDGYSVMLDGTVIAGGVARLYVNVLRGDVPVTDLEPYFGGTGRLVMLREGDLAFLQVDPVPGTGSGPTITFEASVPTPGYYRVFLDFQHEGQVRTAEFTVLAS